MYLLSKRVLQLVNQYPRVPTKNPLSFWNSCSQQSRFHLVNLHQPANKILSSMVILTNCHNYINTPSHLSSFPPPPPLLHPTPTPTITNIIFFKVAIQNRLVTLGLTVITEYVITVKVTCKTDLNATFLHLTSLSKPVT